MVNMGIQIEGLRPLLRRLNQLPKTAQAELREAAQAIADDEAARIASAARGSDRQSAAVAGFVRSRKDRVPAIAAGGTARTGVSGGATAGQLFFGAEFGGGSTKKFTREVTETQYTTRTGKTRTRKTFGAAKFAGRKNTTNQFRPHLGRTGYWFWPQLRADEARMLARWEQALEAIEREWASPGGDS